MQDVVLHGLTDWFKGYVADFRDDEGDLHPMMELKLAHTARVALFGRTIAQDTGWGQEGANLAEAASWLHDVGRFSQWADFGTYRDRDSVDHAARGCEVLSAQAALEGVAPTERDHLVQAVALHNRLLLPDSLTPEARSVCQVVRDADKLDIFDVIYGHLTDGNLGDIIPERSTEPVASPALLEEIRNERRASYRNVRTQTDFVLVSVAWAWDLSFRATARMAADKRVFERLAPFLPDTNEVRAVLAMAIEHLDEVTTVRRSGRIPC